MKLLSLFLCLSSLPSLAQLDTAYFGRYADNLGLTGYGIYALEAQDQLPGFCFSVSKDIYDETGITIYSEVGFAHCTPENGLYAVELNADEPNLWLRFETDGFGEKTVTAITPEKTEETFAFSPLPFDSWEEYEGTNENVEPDVYLRKDGFAFLIGPGERGMDFMIIATGEATECAQSDIDGVLEVLDAQKQVYSYALNGCPILEIRIAGEKAVVKEKKCSGAPRKNCASWSGTYELFHE